MGQLAPPYRSIRDGLLDGRVIPFLSLLTAPIVHGRRHRRSDGAFAMTGRGGLCLSMTQRVASAQPSQYLNNAQALVAIEH
jgi:hypothetical protein